MSAFPDEYQIDYLVMHAAEIMGGYDKALKSDYLDIVKAVVFKKFDSWVEYQYNKSK